jgi:hypothetical protein
LQKESYFRHHSRQSAFLFDSTGNAVTKQNATNSTQVRTDWVFRTIPISVPGHADHSFRDDLDQSIMIVGTVIAMPRNVFHRTR